MILVRRKINQEKTKKRKKIEKAAKVGIALGLAAIGTAAGHMAYKYHKNSPKTKKSSGSSVKRKLAGHIVKKIIER